MAQVKCQFCGLGVEKTLAVKHNSKNYHKECCEQAKQREELNRYICKLFNFKTETNPGPRISTQIKKYRESGFTYLGILNSLKFFYEVKNGSKDKANEGIGIVPYVYEDAQKYYDKREEKIESISQAISNNADMETEIFYIKEKPKRNKKIYNLDEL